MIPLTLQQIAQACSGELFVSENTAQANEKIIKVSTDSRVDCTNSMFVALIGKQFDGHDYVPNAIEKNASVVLVSEKLSKKASDTQSQAVASIVVQDTEKALGDLARFVRQTVKPLVIGITGSAGKTTVKEMVASIMRLKGKTLATKGNFNNHIGVPLTLLELESDHEFAVIEMGANHQGEIAYCASIALPSIAVVNNVAPAHIEGFGSIDGVAKAKYEIYQALVDSNAQAIVNLDGDYAERWMTSIQAQKVTVSCHKAAHFTADNIHLNKNDEVVFEMLIHGEAGTEQLPIELPMVGTHNVSNALVAAALAKSAGATEVMIQQGLAQVENVQGRLMVLDGVKGCRVIDDTYNASVISVKVAADYVAQTEKGVLILGDMAELGDMSAHYHQEVGAYAKSVGVDSLYAVGEFAQQMAQAFGQNGHAYRAKETLIENVMPCLQGNETILVKGSRSAKMEQVVAALVVKTTQTAQITMGDSQAC